MPPQDEFDWMEQTACSYYNCSIWYYPGRVFAADGSADLFPAAGSDLHFASCCHFSVASYFRLSGKHYPACRSKQVGWKAAGYLDFQQKEGLPVEQLAGLRDCRLQAVLKDG